MVAIDLDGTIAPIVRRPERVRVAVRTLRLLERLSGAGRKSRGNARAGGIRVALVSARRLADLRRILPVRGICRVAQYGMEGEVAPSTAVRRRFRARARRVARMLRRVAEGAPGAWVEDKGMSVALHDRLVSPRDRRSWNRAVGHAAREAARHGFRTVLGRKVTEFIPRGYDKGSAMERLRKRFRPDLIVYFGDSEADEPAFAALGPRDFPVRVGPGATLARYRVRGPSEVARFLRELLSLRTGSMP